MEIVSAGAGQVVSPGARVMHLLDVLAYPPILLGGIILLIAGCIFPLPGIFILRLNLVPVRFVMMHGALLGGAIALALGINPLGTTLGVNLAIIGIIALWEGGLRADGSSLPFRGTQITTFLMIVTIALAFLIIYKANVPAKDTLTLLWGSLYALDGIDLVLFAGIAGMDLLYMLGWHRQIVALLYHQEIARTAGVRTDIHYPVVVILSGLTVSLAMRFLGALLVDAIVLLPAFIGISLGSSVRKSFFVATLAGFVSACIGYLLSILIDIPVSSSVTLGGVGLFLCARIYLRLRTGGQPRK